MNTSSHRRFIMGNESIYKKKDDSQGSGSRKKQLNLQYVNNCFRQFVKNGVCQMQICVHLCLV